ncbi:MAG: lysostaphin resistance A-like protein [bacterium]
MKNWLLAGCFVFTIVWLSLFVIPIPSSAPQLNTGSLPANLQAAKSFSDKLSRIPMDLFVFLGLLITAGIGLHIYSPVLPERTFTVPKWAYDGLVGSLVWILAAIGAGFASSKLTAHLLSDSFYYHWGTTLMLQLTLLTSVILLVKVFGESLKTHSFGSVNSWLSALTHGTVEYIRIYPVLILTLVVNQWLVYQLDFTTPPSSYLFILTADTPAKLLLLFGLTCLAAPLIEELFFRGILYRSLRSIAGPKISALAAAFVFSLVHFEFQFFFPLLVLGLLLCLIYEKSGSIKVVITMHFLQNTLSLLIFHRLL